MAEITISFKDISLSVSAKCPQCGFELRVNGSGAREEPKMAVDETEQAVKPEPRELPLTQPMEPLPRPGQLDQLDNVARELAALRVLMFAHRREIDAELEEARRQAQQKTGEVLGRSINALSQIVADMREREAHVYGSRDHVARIDAFPDD